MCLTHLVFLMGIYLTAACPSLFVGSFIFRRGKPRTILQKLSLAMLERSTSFQIKAMVRSNLPLNHERCDGLPTIYRVLGRMRHATPSRDNFTSRTDSSVVRGKWNSVMCWTKFWADKADKNGALKRTNIASSAFCILAANWIED